MTSPIKFPMVPTEGGKWFIGNESDAQLYQHWTSEPFASCFGWRPLDHISDISIKTDTVKPGQQRIPSYNYRFDVAITISGLCVPDSWVEHGGRWCLGMLLEDRFTVFRVLSFTGQTYYGRLVNREPIDWLAFDDGPGIDSTIDVSYDKAWSRAIIGEFRTVLKPKPPKEIVGAYRAHRAWRILPNGETTLERIRALRTEDTYELDLWPVAMSRMGPWRPGWNIASGYNSLRGGQGGFYALHSIAEVFKQARVEQGYSN